MLSKLSTGKSIEPFLVGAANVPTAILVVGHLAAG